MREIEHSRFEMPFDFVEGRFVKGRPLAHILQNVGLSESDLNNRKTLFVGSGVLDFYPREAWEKGFDATFLDPGYGRTEYARSIEDQENEPPGPNAIAGIAEALPFRDYSFDKVIAVASVPVYSVSAKAASEGILDMIRVLKSGGELRLEPFIIEPEGVQYIRANSGKGPDQYSRFKLNRSAIETMNNDERRLINKLTRRRELDVNMGRLGIFEQAYFSPFLIVKKYM